MIKWIGPFEPLRWTCGCARWGGRIKKTLHASEQDRADVARQRAQWPERIAALSQRAASGIEREIAAAGLAAHVAIAGAKGCVVFSAQPVRDYRGYLSIDDRYSHAHWLYQHNGGVFLPPWGKSEQWLISFQHDESDIDRLVINFGVFARAVAP